MNVMRKRLISLNLAILMLLSLVLPAGAAELGAPAAVLTAEQPAAQTGEPAVQADDSAEGIQAIFYTQGREEIRSEYAKVDASADGWTPPALPSAEGGGQNLYWFGIYTVEGAEQQMQCIPGVRYPKLPATVEFQLISSQSTRGIRFSDNGKLAWTEKSRVLTRTPSETDTGLMKVDWMLPSLNGQRFLGWTPTKEDTGEYLTWGDTVPDTDTGWVTLYGQWLPEGTAEIYLNDEYYAYAKRGETFVLPQLDGDDNNVLSGWSIYYRTKDGRYNLQAEQTAEGWQVTVPAGAVRLDLTPSYQFVGTAVVNEKPCNFSGSQQYFRGDGWQLQSMSNGGVRLTLNNYDGGAIDVPAKELRVDYSGVNKVAGGTDAPALCSTGYMQFNQYCEDTHSYLTITAGSGQSAVSAKDLQLAPHLTLTGGAGATALDPKTALEQPRRYNLYDAAGNELTGGYTSVSYLETRAISIPVTINGNGGVAEGDKTTLELTEDSCTDPDLEGLFTWSSHVYNGYIASDSYDNTTGKINGRTYMLRWIDTKLEHFISFYVGEKVLETLDFSESWGPGYLFRDNSEGTTVTAPTVTYTNSSRALAYWEYRNNDTAAVRQYLPGEQVTESDGTKLTAVSIRPNAQLLLVSGDLTSGSKTFDEQGTRIWTSDWPGWETASDGTRLVSWNTRADGKGTAYAPNTEIDLSGRTTPLVLYAQWQQAGKTAIYFEDTFDGYAEPGTTYQFTGKAASEGCTLLGWSGSWYQNGEYRDWVEAKQTEDGMWTVEIPAEATELHLYKQEFTNQPFTVDGKTCYPNEDERFFSGDGWWASCYTDGSMHLELRNYNGGAMDLPASSVRIALYQTNVITGDESAPALRCGGKLVFTQNCDSNDDTQHSKLTITAGSGQNAIAAQRIQLAPHITLNGGTDATAVSSEAKVLTAYNYSLCDGADNALTGGYNNVPRLKAVPVYSTVTLNGNGGVTTNGDTVLANQRYENGNRLPNLGKIFKKSGSQYVGADMQRNQGGGYSNIINGDCTISAVWADTGYEHFVSFYMDCAVENKEETLDYKTSWGGGYIFRDNSQTVTAPKVTFEDTASNGNLVYWYPESSISDPECGHQYLPDETVNEADGTVLYPATVYPRRQVVLMANGKTFAKNGAHVLIRTSLPNVMAADGSELVHWNEDPKGNGMAYGVDAELDLSENTEPLVLYAQWLPKDEIKVTIDMGKGSCAMSAKPGTRYELPEMISSTEDRVFDHWGAYYRTKDGEYPDLEVKKGANGKWYVDIPADAAEVTCRSYFLPTGTFNIGGTLCKFERPDQVFKDENGKWTLHYDWENNGCVVLRLYGYHGGKINLPLAEAAIEVYENSTITTANNVPALEAYGTLWLVTLCGEDKHPTLTVTGVEGQSAIDAPDVTFNGPHIVVTTQGPKAVKGKVNWAGDICALCGGTGADNPPALTWKEAQAEDLTYLKTDPLFSDVTFRGKGGKATDGSQSETLVKRYENGIYAKNLDRLFKKTGALYAGYAVGGRRYEESTSLYINGDGTVDILWADSKYPNFVAFHTMGVILEKLEETDYNFGWGAGYLFRDNSKTVIAPTITYKDPVSNGNLIYWYASDDGEEADDAKQYLPGDVVKEENGTELYPAVVYANWNVAFMSNGKVFKDGKLAIIAKQCPKEMTATDGTKLIGWNTEKDGSGQAYELGSEPDLAGRTEPLVLYAQWQPVYVAKVEPPQPSQPGEPEKPETGGTLTITPKEPEQDHENPDVKPEKPAPITEKQQVLVGVYRWGMMIAVLQGWTDDAGVTIHCTVPKGMNLKGCALKLFVLSEEFAPDRKVEFILMDGN